MDFQVIDKYDGVSLVLSKLEFEQGPSEYNIVVTLSEREDDFADQADRLLSAYNDFCSEKLPFATPVFERYFLSDIANQQPVLEKMIDSVPGNAVSIVEQPPLNGSKIAMWAWLQTEVVNRNLYNGIFETNTGNSIHLRTASESEVKRGSKAQAKELLLGYSERLNELGLTLADNCVRTWLFVQNIDNNYQGVVVARNDLFSMQGLTNETHFISSTGIAGRSADKRVLVQLDTYAVAGIEQEQISFLYAPEFLNRTSEYGVSFERGTAVTYGDRKQVFISGTASINNKGEVVFSGDIVMQTHRMLQNVEALLSEAGCGFDDVAQMIVYLRDIADYKVVNRLFSGIFPQHPYVILHAPVCRPGWLIEMECIAIKKEQNERFVNY
ncbi:MAG: hypothetical protein J6U97_01535 [Bacteroidaceae bacterium]|nr:hypothetical protein [Bacteroidaceae bacterium]